MSYESHVFTDVKAQQGESLRRRCSCGALRRVTVTLSGAHIVETSTDDGATWSVTEYGLPCPRRVA